MYSLPPLTKGNILNRYKRFLADVRLEDGRVITAHCPNTGAMTACWEPGAPVQLSYSDNPKRKLPWTLERIDMGRGWIGVNTNRVNGIIAAAVQGGQIPQLSGYRRMQTEPPFAVSGYAKSRFDILLTDGHRPDAYVEIKNTTLVQGDAIRFPDAVTERGRKHLRLLLEAVKQGYRGIIVFALNRPEGRYFEPAWEIDPNYGYTLGQVTEEGVEALAVRLKHHDRTIVVAGSQAARWRKGAT